MALGAGASHYPFKVTSNYPTLFMALKRIPVAPLEVPVPSQTLIVEPTFGKKANNDITEHSIRDCLRLGKFNSTRAKPRPLLVKLSRAFDVNTILYNRSKIPKGIQVKPDMNKEEKLREQLVLKERWSLISSDTDKKHIRIRGTKLNVKNQIHGEIIDSTFIPKPRTEASNTSSNNSTMEVGSSTSQ